MFRYLIKNTKFSLLLNLSYKQTRNIYLDRIEIDFQFYREYRLINSLKLITDVKYY